MVLPSVVEPHVEVRIGTVSCVPTRGTTIRLPEHLHDLIRAAADESGISFASYVREAIIMRYAFEYSLRRSKNEAAQWKEMQRLIHRWERSGFD